MLREFADLDLRADLPRLVVAAVKLAMAAAWRPLVAEELLVALVLPPRVLLQQVFPAALCLVFAAWWLQAVFHPWVSHPRACPVASHRLVWRRWVSPHLALNH